MEQGEREALRPFTIASATLSFAGAALLASTWLGLRRGGRGTSAQPEAATLAASRAVALVVVSLAVGDALMASSFLIAQLPTGASGNHTGGAACYAGGMLLEYGFLTTGLWSAVLACVVERLLASPATQAPLIWHHRTLLSALVWGVPLVVELALLFAYDLPETGVAPQADLPWCASDIGVADLKWLMGALPSASFLRSANGTHDGGRSFWQVRRSSSDETVGSMTSMTDKGGLRRSSSDLDIMGGMNLGGRDSPGMSRPPVIDSRSRLSRFGT